MSIVYSPLFTSSLGMCVSRVFKDQVYGAFNLFSLIWLFGLRTAATVSDILIFFSNYLYVVVLVHFVKAELALEGIRQFHVAGEIEEIKLDTFCDLHESLRFGSLCLPRDCWSGKLNAFCYLHETPRYGSSGFPVCLPRFGMRVHSRCLDWVAHGTLVSWSESCLAQETRVCEFRVPCRA